ncbi:uncharacterized protein BYT42DRAFT_647322 [Radiomyces spectabilis]|uniref:uncharacterized protein n=1 Tax=Radiomyces spectabilis TaxID=64574 RepID=UPI00221FD42C|nr:uncharacterized protein BYT42DRAFT_647322 [Radiomyces spectabilis]KAI8371506.1 hypothetical protein BYT42DRAFT_647322 [Radiomyces spectabilis]
MNDESRRKNCEKKIMDEFLRQQHLAIQSSGLVPTKDRAAGSLLLKQPNFVSVPLPSTRRDRCNYCLNKTTLQCCSRCHSAYFCSNECFRNAWLHFHRELCEPQEYDIYKSVDVDRWLFERVILTLDSHVHLNKQHSYAMEALQKVPCPTSDSMPDALAAFQCLPGTTLTREQQSALWQRVRYSCFPIVDPDQRLEPVAVGLFPLTAAFVGHSCRPNTGIIYKGNTQILVALRDIESGTPITVNYVDLIATKKQRTAALRQRFGPDYACQCSRCVGEYSELDRLLDEANQNEPWTVEALKQQFKTWSVLDMAKQYATKDAASCSPPVEPLDAPNFSHYTSRIMAPDLYYPTLNLPFRKNQRKFHTYTVEHDERALRALHALCQGPTIPALSLSSIVTTEKLLAQYMAHDRWVEASRAALYLFVVYRLIYPPLHPQLAYHLVVLARASWNSLVQLELAGIGKKLERIYENGVRTWIEIARDAVASTFGQSTSLWREIIELQWVFERDQKLK